MRIGIKFSRTGNAKFISHLDMQRLFSRALRRAKLPVKFSQGFNPHIITSFASALSVGMETLGDYMEFYTVSDVDLSAVKNSLNDAMPDSISIVKAGEIDEKAPKLMAASKAAKIEIICSDERYRSSLIEGISDIIKSESCICAKKSKGKMREFDIRPLIYKCDIDEEHIILSLAHSGEGSLSPNILIDEAKRRAKIECDVYPIRIDLLIKKDGKLVSMSEMFS